MLFKGNEIIDLAIRIEQNGLKFYNTLVEKTESEKACEIFKHLAAQEEAHEKIFKSMLLSLLTG